MRNGPPICGWITSVKAMHRRWVVVTNAFPACGPAFELGNFDR